jgi:hypothetical protein
MKTYCATFKKQNGQPREMRFVRIKDLPESFLNNLIKNKSKSNGKQLMEGLEIVYDLEKNGLRIFNWKTVIGEIKEIDKEIKDLTRD